MALSIPLSRSSSLQAINLEHNPEGSVLGEKLWSLAWRWVGTHDHPCSVSTLLWSSPSPSSKQK